MTTNFPSSLDSLTNPSTSDNLSSVSHVDQHSNANDAIEALQTKVGINSSADASSLDYKVTALDNRITDKYPSVTVGFDNTCKYVCDGTDDNIQIQAAIDEVANSATEGSVYLATGVYYISASLDIKCNLYGEGSSTVTISATPAFTGSYLAKTSVTDVTISGIKFAGNGANQTTESFDGLYLDAPRVRVIDCSFDDFNPNVSTYAAIRFASFDWGSDGIVDNCLFDAIYGSCIQIESSVKLIVINGCRFESGAYGVYIDSENAKITNSLFGTNVGIYIDSTADPSEIINNSFYPLNTAIDIRNSENIVHSNRFAGGLLSADNTYDAIYIHDNSDNNIISGNIITAGLSNFRYGIRVNAATCNKNIIYGNQVLDGQTGRISDAGTDTDVSHNITS